MFVILQKYDFSSKSQRENKWKNNRCDVCDTAKVRFFKQITTPCQALVCALWCLWYCKSTIFQANHNKLDEWRDELNDVCDTAKVRFFKQITTQPKLQDGQYWCLWYCKSTIFQANHNQYLWIELQDMDVCDTAKVRFFKQITTILM